MLGRLKCLIRARVDHDELNAAKDDVRVVVFVVICGKFAKLSGVRIRLAIVVDVVLDVLTPYLRFLRLARAEDVYFVTSFGEIVCDVRFACRIRCKSTKASCN